LSKTYLFECGNHPALSRAELAHRYQHFEITPLKSKGFFLLSGSEILDPQKFLDGLGGFIRIAEVLGEYSQSEISQATAERLAAVFAEGKIVFGLSRFPEDKRLLKTLLIGAKKALTGLGRGSRFVNRDFRNLDAGTLHKERLFVPNGAEFLVLPAAASGQYLLAQTLAAQDVEAFAARDYGKPARDMVVGMLPPKLALMLINLSATDGRLPVSLWDPFCGTGTILVEAARLGIEVFGSDLAPEMIAASRQNLAHFFPGQIFRLAQHDITKGIPVGLTARVIVTEGHLGPLYANPLKPFQLAKARAEMERLYARYFHFLASSPIRKIVMSLPFWKLESGKDAHLEKILAEAEKFWKNTLAVSEKTGRQSLLFRRPNQVVGREIIVLERKP
jgi:tRNA G10  N-methylase Trm11